MEQFDIAEALRYAPKGLKLYSPLLGEVRLEKVSDHDDTIVVTTKYKSERVFFEDGKYDSNGECLLFPSINHRCWNNWQNTLFLESIGSVCVDTLTNNKFILGEDGTYFGDNTGNSYHFLIDDEDSGNYLLNSRYASPEEAKEFFDELEKNGYEWDGKMVVKSTSQPKFKVGDWVLYSGDHYEGVRHITKIDENGYYIERNGLPHGIIPFEHEICMTLWTIQDAKDGDVLVDVYGNIGIFQKNDDFDWSSYCSLGPNGGFRCFAIEHELDGSHPATKEQRDLLFQKMKEEGYEWDAEKKELKKIEQKPVNDTVETIVEAVSNTSILDMIEDKDVFTNSGAFENSLGHLLKLFEKLPKQDLLDGLKFYTNVVEHDGKYVKPTEWSDEDERMCQETIDWFEKKCFPYALEHENPARESIKWLKSLKERLS